MSHASMIMGLPGLEVMRVKATHKRTVKHTRRGNQVMIQHLKVPRGIGHINALSRVDILAACAARISRPVEVTIY